MKIRWLGHSCFLISSKNGIKLITDPYSVGSGINYGNIRESAHIVTVSHEHGDHSNVAAISGNPAVIRGSGSKEAKGITFKGIPTYHDTEEGKKRGNNTIFCFTIDNLKICHLGDLGHMLSRDQVADIGEIDILLLPVGGFYTIDATVATRVWETLKPKVSIPMHFKTPKCDYPIQGVDNFLQGKRMIRKLEVSEVEFHHAELPLEEIIVLLPAL